MTGFLARLWGALVRAAETEPAGRSFSVDERAVEQEERDARRRDLEARPGRPKWPTGMVLPVGAIQRIRDEQREYDRDPLAYERRERQRREERELEQMREREAEEEAYYRWRQEGAQ